MSRNSEQLPSDPTLAAPVCVLKCVKMLKLSYYSKTHMRFGIIRDWESLWLNLTRENMVDHIKGRKEFGTLKWKVKKVELLDGKLTF